VRLETDFTKTWNFGNSRSLVAHVNAGAICSFGNSTNNDTPFSELFYVGGANSIRAFTVRSIGPGSFIGVTGDKQLNYLLRNGDLKFVCNLEYRTRLFGNMHGALFIDAGNVWCWDKFKLDDFSGDPNDEQARQEYEKDKQVFNEWFKGITLDMPNLLDQMALGTGVGIRYDLGFLVVRVDWGLALHAPYDTGKSGYLNISRFRDAHTLHLAIGYPF
jgi:outer membrane protein assembly factor BamA